MNKKLSFISLEDWGGLESTSFFMKLAGFTQTKQLEEADIIVFNGGADIGTQIYGEIPVMDRIPLYPSNRDKKECGIFEKYKGDKFFFGICRGAQLLNCLNGGTLWQHADNHGQDHPMVDIETGRIYNATSTHHQMMRPNISSGKVIAVASESDVKFAASGKYVPVRSDDLIRGEDVEIVWYPESRSLCIQGHPEYVPGSAYANYCVNLIKDKYHAVAA